MPSNRASPVDLGGFGAPGSGQDVEVVSDLVYLAHGGGGLRIIDLGSEYAQTIEVDLDIQPGSESNSVRLEGRVLLPVAILGSESFDVADVDVTSLMFGPAGAAPAHAVGDHLGDVDADGLVDLVSHYRIEGAGFSADDARACVIVSAPDNMPLEGCDTIRLH
jgi:hypothetical protein